MRTLTDCPDALGGGSGAAAWRRESPDAWSATERALWAALGGGAEAWVGRGLDAARPGFWSLLLAVAHAPDSQFDVLRRLLAGGLVLPGPVACLALSGRRFHGHHGREWVAAAGNLHLSAALDAGGLAAGNGVALTMLPAVAAVEGITEASGGTSRPGIKWVNDVLIAGRKVAGVLAATRSSGDRITEVVLGIGVNVAAAPEVRLTPFVPAVGSLAGAGVEVSLADVLAAILGAVAARFQQLRAEGPGALHEAYRRYSVVIGREVCIWDDVPGGEPDPARTPPRARGVVRDIGPDLSLHLEGRAEPVREGRLAIVGNL
jgi:BirA family biotin operon repressor/biotin-[acetyl-CoA-carboxylase] ligase